MNGLVLLANIPLQHRPCLGEKILLSVKLLNQSQELKGLVQDMDGDTLVICPSPTLADDTRALLGENIQVLTISRFISDLLERSECEKPVIRKSELMLELATIWKKYDPELSVELFGQAFNMFTELRSYSLQLELFEEVLEGLDSRISRSIQIFWAYCETLDIIDEHKAYEVLSEWLQKIDKSSEKDFPNLVFTGFSHLNGNQIDFIKNLGLRTNVIIPFPRQSYLESHSQDYIRWFDEPDDISTPLPSFKKRSSLNVFRFPKGRLSEALKIFDKNHQSIAQLDIVLLSKKLEKRFVMDLPLSHHFYKSPATIFEQDYFFISDLLTQEFSQTREKIEAKNVSEFLNEQLNKELKVDFNSKNFRRIKLWTSLIELFDNYILKSELNERISHYDLKILLEVLSLNRPRVYSFPLHSKDRQEGGTLKSIEGLSRHDSKRGVIVCAQKEYPPLKSGKMQFSQEAQRILAGIGPVRRSDVELSLLKVQLVECLEKDDASLMLERGLDESDPAWDEILELYEVSYTDLIPHAKKNIVDYFSREKIQKPLKSFSATKLQSFIDCPRKYYYQYIEALSNREELKTQLRADELGSLEHKIIEKYAETEYQFDTDRHLSLTKDILDKYLLEEFKEISSTRYGEYLNELKVYSQNGLECFYQLKEHFNQGTFKFEKKIEHQNGGLTRKGSIDLYIQNAGALGVIDFKRSAGSIPTQKAISNFEKIQLWFYLNSILKDEKILFSGFFNLSEPEASLFMVPSKEIKDDLSSLGIKSFVAQELDDQLSKYKEFEKKIIKKIETEKTFAARPVKPDVCRYCDLQNVCPRG